MLAINRDYVHLHLIDKNDDTLTIIIHCFNLVVSLYYEVQFSAGM